MDDDNGERSSFVIGLIENRAKEVGVAAFDLRTASLHLSQYIETSSSYQNTKTLLDFYEPMVVIVPPNRLAADGMVGVSQLADRFYSTTRKVIMARGCFDDTRGAAIIKNLAAKEPSALGLDSYSKQYYLCLAAAAAIIKWTEAEKGVIVTSHSLLVTFNGSFDHMSIDSTSVQNLEIIEPMHTSLLGTNNKKRSLFQMLKTTKTFGGARLFNTSTNSEKIVAVFQIVLSRRRVEESPPVVKESPSPPLVGGNCQSVFFQIRSGRSIGAAVVEASIAQPRAVTVDPDLPPPRRALRSHPSARAGAAGSRCCCHPVESLHCPARRVHHREQSFEMAEDGKFRIEKFDGTDFSWWKMQIEDLLVQKDLDVVLGDKPEKMSDADWAGLDRKAMSMIRLSLTKNVAFNILKEKTAKGIMDALSNMYEKPSAANKVFLIRELVNTKMKEGTSVTEHINKLNSILARLLSIRDLVLGEDVRRKSSGESSGELLHVGRGRRNSRGSGSRNRQRSQSKTRDSSGVTCWKCKEVGHFRNQCPNDKKVNIAQGSTSDEEVALTCCEESNVDSWVMDSGASFHATHSGEALQNLVVVDFGKVRLADDRALEVTGMGDMVLKTSVGLWTLKDVRVVPALKKSLISVRQLDEQGHEVKFRDGQWKVVKGNLVIARGKKRGSLYMVGLPSEGVTVPVQKRNKVRFTESRGQNKVVCAREKPRATGQTQDERAWKGLRGPVRGIYGSGSSSPRSRFNGSSVTQSSWS
ncbi:unnamed protein product [Cuscuta campestris]|uniref:CCHC-type domain-containing protein n=1 Tax=Cuscuta campestris TaxID=132261 RepID=A0A484KFL7_9ASTE|nr:unnamed protein product [Cuscuta campestris]